MYWIVRGLRGLRTFMAQAVKRIEAGDIAAKGDAVLRASELLSFMQGLLNHQGEAFLDEQLTRLYTSFQVSLTKAHAENSVDEFRRLSDEIGKLESEMDKLAVAS